MEQVDRIAQAATDVQILKLKDCRHSPHRDCPAPLLASVVPFVHRVSAQSHPPGYTSGDEVRSAERDCTETMQLLQRRDVSLG
jgi:hypothetical protein